MTTCNPLRFFELHSSTRKTQTSSRKGDIQIAKQIYYQTAHLNSWASEAAVAIKPQRRWSRMRRVAHTAQATPKISVLNPLDDVTHAVTVISKVTPMEGAWKELVRREVVRPSFRHYHKHDAMDKLKKPLYSLSAVVCAVAISTCSDQLGAFTRLSVQGAMSQSCDVALRLCS